MIPDKTVADFSLTDSEQISLSMFGPRMPGLMSEILQKQREGSLFSPEGSLLAVELAEICSDFSLDSMLDFTIASKSIFTGSLNQHFAAWFSYFAALKEDDGFQNLLVEIFGYVLKSKDKKSSFQLLSFFVYFSTVFEDLITSEFSTREKFSKDVNFAFDQLASRKAPLHTNSIAMRSFRETCVAKTEIVEFLMLQSQPELTLGQKLHHQFGLSYRKIKAELDDIQEKVLLIITTNWSSIDLEGVPFQDSSLIRIFEDHMDHLFFEISRPDYEEASICYGVAKEWIQNILELAESKSILGDPSVDELRSQLMRTGESLDRFANDLQMIEDLVEIEKIESPSAK